MYMNSYTWYMNVHVVFFFYLSSFEFTDIWNQSKMNLWPRKGEGGTEIEEFGHIYGQLPSPKGSFVSE